uniref:Uncharacterized protein n=1 Tax=Meloidogyne floridensis TaxID=298350 RepID=A0A915P1Y2_9BILA
MNLKINIYLFLILFTNLINSNYIQNNPNIFVEYTEENKKQIKINLINIEFIKNNEEEEISTEGNQGELNVLVNFDKKNQVKIEIEINGILNEEDKLHLMHSSLTSYKDKFSFCNYGISENNKIYTKKDIINLNKNKKIIYLNEKVEDEYLHGLDICLKNETKNKALVKIRPVFYGLVEINIRDENGNELNSNNVVQTTYPGVNIYYTDPVVKIRPIFDGLIEINMRDEKGNYLQNSNNFVETIRPSISVTVVEKKTDKEKCLNKFFGSINERKILKEEFDKFINIKIVKTKNKKYKDGDMIIGNGMDKSKIITRVYIQPMFELKNKE